MCIGIPMQVRQLRPGHALVRGRGEERWVSTALIGDCAPGDWLLIFIDGAREQLGAERAAEVNATLDLIEASMRGHAPDPALDPGFALPSSMSAAQLAELAGGAPARSTATATVTADTSSISTEQP